MKKEKDREKYNQVTLDAMKEAKEIARDSKYPSYETLDELKKALLDENHRKKVTNWYLAKGLSLPQAKYHISDFFELSIQSEKGFYN